MGARKTTNAARDESRGGILAGRWRGGAFVRNREVGGGGGGA